MKIGALIIVWLGVVLLVSSLTYVPWVFTCRCERNMNVVRHAGYYCVFSPPEVPGSLSYEGLSRECWSVDLDKSRILVQSLAIMFLFGAAYISLGIVKPK
jgi:hypothetical protein